jgi:hypothetical protein
VVEQSDTQEIVVAVRPTAADLRVRNRWWGPGALRARASCLCAMAASVAFSALVGAVVLAVVVLVGFWLVMRLWGALGARREAASFPATTARIDAHGLRLSGASEIAIPWAAASATTVQGDRLLVRRGGHRYVVPLTEVRAEERAWLQGVVATSRRSGQGPAPTPDLEAPPEGPGALVLRWTSAARDGYVLQRFLQRTMPEVRRGIWGCCLSFGIVAAAAHTIASPTRGPGSALLVLGLGTALGRILFPAAIAKGVARQAIDGPRVVRLDSVGVSAATPITRWHGRWDTISWGRRDDVICLRTGPNVLGIPVNAIPDPPTFLAELAQRAGPPLR